MENHDRTDFEHEYTPVTYARSPNTQNHQRYVPIDLKLQENKERRYIIEKIRQREKKEILRKRREK